MELNRDDQKREVKQHGTYGFPIYIGRKWISSYPTGYFPWHWHDEVEFTLVVSGQLEYRVNDFHCSPQGRGFSVILELCILAVWLV